VPATGGEPDRIDQTRWWTASHWRSEAAWQRDAQVGEGLVQNRERICKEAQCAGPPDRSCIQEVGALPEAICSNRNLSALPRSQQ
jgi:hypothetical protein